MVAIQGVYLALFGRPADPAGLAFFNELTDNGTDLSAIGDLTASAEYGLRFQGMSIDATVNAIYQGLFERDAEPTGLGYWVGKLNSGELTMSTLPLAILQSAAGGDLDMLNAKIAAAELFTASLDQPEEIEAYAGDFAIRLGRDLIADVETDDPATQEEVDALIERLIAHDTLGLGDGGINYPSLDSRADAILTRWAELEAASVEGADRAEIDAGFALLGLEYIDYLNFGGTPLTDAARPGLSFHDHLLSYVPEPLADPTYGDPEAGSLYIANEPLTFGDHEGDAALLASHWDDMPFTW